MIRVIPFYIIIGGFFFIILLVLDNYYIGDDSGFTFLYEYITVILLLIAFFVFVEGLQNRNVIRYFKVPFDGSDSARLGVDFIKRLDLISIPRHFIIEKRSDALIYQSRRIILRFGTPVNKFLITHSGVSDIYMYRGAQFSWFIFATVLKRVTGISSVSRSSPQLENIISHDFEF